MSGPMSSNKLGMLLTKDDIMAPDTEIVIKSVAVRRQLPSPREPRNMNVAKLLNACN
jgi:hypothetical protein